MSTLVKCRATKCETLEIFQRQLDCSFTLKTRIKYDAGRSIIEGAHIHIFVFCQLMSFKIDIQILKSIVFTVCEQEYMNMGTSIIGLSASLSITSISLTFNPSPPLKSTPQYLMHINAGSCGGDQKTLHIVI